MYSEPAVECVFKISSKQIDEIAARGSSLLSQLRYSLHRKREAGGNRTHDLRRLMHGLRTGSQSASALRQKSSENPGSSEEVAETPSLSNLVIRQWTRGVVCLRLQPLH